MNKNENAISISLPLFMSGIVITFILGAGITYLTLSASNPLTKTKPNPTAATTPTPEKDLSSKTPEPNSADTQEKSNPTEEKTPALSLTPKDSQELINLLRTDYIDSASLLSQPLKPEKVTDYIQATPTKIKISFAPLETYPPEQHNIIELLPNHIGYLRLTQIRQEDINNLTSQWPQWNEKPLIGLIIDLRFSQEQKNFESTAQFLSLFVSPNTPLFTLKDSKSELETFQSSSQPLGIPADIPILVIINQETRGAGELIASYLKKKLSAILIGNTTPGEAGLFAPEQKLASGRFVRLAKATALLPDKTELLGQAIEPDIPLKETDQTSDAWLVGSKKGIKPTLTEITPFPRRNWFDKNAKRAKEPKPTINIKDNSERDSFLQKATSIIRSIHITQQPAPATVTKTD